MSNSLTELINDIEKYLDVVTIWQSSLKIKQTKNEPCQFYKRDVAAMTISQRQDMIVPKNAVKVSDFHGLSRTFNGMITLRPAL
jgi:hypothetical protein